MDRVVAEVSARVERIPFTAAIDRGRGVRHGAVVAAAVVALGAFVVAAPATFGLWLRRNVLLSAVEWPRRTALSFVEPVVRLPQGDDLTLRVAAHGVVPEQVHLSYRFAGGERGSERMTLTGDAEFRATLTAILDSVTVRAAGGDGETEELTIAIVQRPAITGLRVAVEPPPYAGEASTHAAEGDLRVLRGSKLTISARCDKPAREAFLLLGEAEKRPLAVGADGHSLHGELVPTETGAVVVDVVDHDRLGARTPPRLYVRVHEDQPPTVDLRLAGVGSMVTPIALIPAELTARDDYGLVEVSAWHRVTGKPAVAATAEATAAPAGEEDDPDLPTDVQPNPAPAETEPEFTPLAVSGLDGLGLPLPEVRTQITVDLRELAIVQPGQMLALRVDAKDNRAPGEAHTSHGEPAVFRIVTADELAADLQRRQLEQRKLLEAVLAQQEAARAQLHETIAPASDDPRAGQARQKLLQLGKTERDLGARCGSIGQTYGQILDEALNNRIAQAADLRGLRERVVQPLAELSLVDFPAAASATETYAGSGNDDLKQLAIATYDKIIAQIKSILVHMQEEERLAAVVSMLREVIKLQDQAADDASKRRGEAGAGVFGTGRDNKDEAPRPKGDGKK